jgi:hypothetical protein
VSLRRVVCGARRLARSSDGLLLCVVVSGAWRFCALHLRHFGVDGPALAPELPLGGWRLQAVRAGTGCAILAALGRRFADWVT